MTQYFVDQANNYIGGFDGDAALVKVPVNSIEVPFPPDDARQKWIPAQNKYTAKPVDAVPVTQATQLATILKGKGLITQADLDTVSAAVSVGV